MSRMIFLWLMAFSLPLSAELPKQSVIEDIQNYYGWCSVEKAELIMDIIQSERPLVCVDIGTFGGAAFSVIAKTVKYNGKGMVFAIDPWSKAEATKGFHPTSRLYKWWSEVDLDGVFRQFCYRLGEDHLLDVSQVYRLTSAEALPLFEDERRKTLATSAMDEVNDRFGGFKVTYGTVLENDERGSFVISPAWRPEGIRNVEVS